MRATDLLTIDADGNVLAGRVGRHPGGAHPHRAAPPPRRRRGRRAQPPAVRVGARRRSASCPTSCTRTRRSSPTSSCSSPTTTARSTSPRSAPSSPSSIGDASVALLVSHGVIVTAPTIEEAVYKSVLFERTCMLHWLVRAMDRAPDPDRADAPEAAEGVAGRTRRAGVLARRRAHARRATSPRCWSSRWPSRSRSSRRSRASPPPPRARSPGCPSPNAAERRYTVISVDDHIVEPPDAFEGRLPGAVRRARAACRRARRRQRGVGVRGPGAAERRLQRGRRPPGRPSTASSRPASTRCGAARGTSRARIADMDLNGVYASVCFPSFLPGFAGSAPAAAHRRPRARARVRAGVERLGDRGLGGRTRPGA